VLCDSVIRIRLGGDGFSVPSVILIAAFPERIGFRHTRDLAIRVDAEVCLTVWELWEEAI
jgi:hypothetical protein